MSFSFFRKLADRLLVTALVAVLLTACGGSSSTSTPETSPPPDPEPETDPFEVRVEQLNMNLSPLESTQPDSALDDLAPLARVAQAQVIGMGEATHGTQEFSLAKHKIFRWLVENREVTVLAMESDVAEAVYLDRYVQTGEGDLESIMLERMHYWPWYTEEVRDLIQWMSDYNAENPESPPLRYIGVDCGLVGLQPDLILEFVIAAMPELGEETEAVVLPLRMSQQEMVERYADMTRHEFEDLMMGLESLQSTLLDNQSSLEAGGSEADYRMLMYILKSLIDSHQMAFDYYNEDDFWVRFRFRERCLADNTILIEELIGQDTRSAVWAHNLHVGNGMALDAHPQMGHYLRQDLGSDYGVIGFSFSHGDFMAFGPDGLTSYEIELPPQAGSPNELLHAAEADSFILDIGALPGSELLDWFSSPRQTLAIGAAFDPDSVSYVPERLSESYDVLIHIDQSTPTNRLPFPD